MKKGLLDKKNVKTLFKVDVKILENIIGNNINYMFIVE